MTQKDLKMTADVPTGANSCNVVELFPGVCTETPSFRHNNLERIEIYSPYKSTWILAIGETNST